MHFKLLEGSQEWARKQWVEKKAPNVEEPLLYVSSSQPFTARVPPNRKRKIAFPPVIYENLSVNLKLMKIWRTPRNFSRNPGGTRTPDWEPLLYVFHFYESFTKTEDSWRTRKRRDVLNVAVTLSLSATLGPSLPPPPFPFSHRPGRTPPLPLPRRLHFPRLAQRQRIFS